MSRGSHTKEYRLFLCNISRLSEGTSHAVEEFATKAHEKQLIATARVEEATCLYISSYIRASNLLQTLLTRIQLDSNIFYTVCDILKSIPALEPMADVLSTDDSPSTSDNVEPQSSTPQQTGRSSNTISHGSSSSPATGRKACTDRSMEYQLFLSNISTLAEGLETCKEARDEFATQALKRHLITSSKAEDAMNPLIPSYLRASNLLQILLVRIQLNTEDFYTVCDILRSISALKPMADILKTPNDAGVH